MNSDEDEDYYYSCNSGSVNSDKDEDYYYSCNSEASDSPLTLQEQSDNSEESPVSRLDKNYRILKAEDIIQCQNDDISTVSNILSVSRGAACSLLRYHNWNVDNVYDQFFADDQNRLVRHDLILNNHCCEICFDINPKSSTSMISATTCGKHFYCTNCWITYIHKSINDAGLGCLMLRCPEPSCQAIVDLDMIDSLPLSSEDKDKYYKYLQRSYVENSNRKRKWCSGPRCDYVVQYEYNKYDDEEKYLYDVTCHCSNKFCWNCMEESHRPVDCKMVEEWKSTSWILANTKPCPMCKRAIEKNQGCNRMTCISPCWFQFCWVCLGPFKESHVCTATTTTTTDETIRPTITTDDDDKKINRETVVHLEKKTTPSSYYERWAYHDSLMKGALVDLSRARTEHIQKLTRMYGESYAQLKFVTEAWDQIIECSRVLKWSCAYGYYMPENNKWKKNFFEYLLWEAGFALKRLRICAEQEMVQYLDDKGVAPSKKSFNDFRSKLVGLTGVTKNFFENLVRALENGLPEVESFGTTY